ncbi:MAG: endonuclease [Melioribacteraceae bacterium]|nr:endonuclease [Melioribacteraceae bacterium]MCF8356239.1 endonuclease [Melioribacteraceae bacterium]MCF8394990.1 endonuclease [Melioribacteraceae bacterium]MCF8419710.1 endonuclease [Melioribacteraceae bacterium]
MLNTKSLILFMGFLSQITFGMNQFSVSDTLINFGEVLTGTSSSETIVITNSSDTGIQILGIYNEEIEFKTNLVEQTIPPGSEVNFEISFKPRHNIDYTDFLFIAMSDTNAVITIEMHGTGIYQENYYSLTQNLWGEELKSTLTGIIDNHYSLGYTAARDNMYASIDNHGGSVECVYTGRTAEFNTRAGANENSFNCEHTIPQSFFDSNEPMRSDIFHLYPTDVNANSRRSNYDFGIVTSGITWQEGGSKLGKNAQNLTVFEPRDVHKGDVARSHFYFMIRYDGSYDGYQNSQVLEEVFRQWHLSDTVDVGEKNRNQAIYNLQNNRNPFIDHPELVERIPKFFGTQSYQFHPEISLPLISIDMDTVFQSETSEYIFTIANTGMAELSISSIILSDTNFSVIYDQDIIDAESKMNVIIKFNGVEEITSYSSIVTIVSSDEDEPEIELPVSIVVEELTSVEDSSFPVNFSLEQNYPNPFNPTTTITFSVPQNEFIVLDVYNLLGEKITSLLNEEKPAGRYEVSFNASNLPSGTYFYRLNTGSNSSVKKMILLR